MKQAYSGMYIELDFSQNLALRPKDEVQSAHFSGKQFTLHCSIVDPVTSRYHFHLSDDTTHDPVFVDQVLRDLIAKYDIKDQDLWIQSDNAPTQYKNKNAFFLFEQLAKEFNLRIIRSYGAAGHGKGAIDAMSSFGVKNILRKDIVTRDIFFNQSEDIVDYLSIKCPNFHYIHLPRGEIVKSRITQKNTKVIPDCMKQHLMIFSPKEPLLCKEYLCSCVACLEFKFNECSEENLPLSDIPCDDDFGDFNDDYEDEDQIDKTDQIFNFVDVPSFVSLFSGSPNEPLYFVKVIGKGIASENLSDAYGHVVSSGEKFFKGFYMKLGRSKTASKKKYQLLPSEIFIAPDEVFDTYVEFTEDLFIDANMHKFLIQKANSYI